jgi:taurine dioxygenase
MADPTIEIEAVTPNIGAEIRGVDLRDDLGEPAVRTIRQALLDHLVLFFRDQELTPEQHLAFAARFGELRLPMGGRPPEGDGIAPYFDVLEDTPENPPKADFWHTDVAFVREPPDIAVLAMEETPKVGGDTSWLSLYAFYDALSPSMQEVAAGLEWELHLGRPFRLAVTAMRGEEAYREIAAAIPVMRHPVVRIHPETGRRALYWCGPFVEGIAGLSAEESDGVVQLLRGRLDDPNLQVRWRWRRHDVAMWDERCTNHRANSDHAPAYRRIRRCVVGSAVPEGPRGPGGKEAGPWQGDGVRTPYLRQGE